MRRLRTNTSRPRRGFSMVEAIVSFGLFLVIAAFVTWSLSSSYASRTQERIRENVSSAISSNLTALAATGTSQLLAGDFTVPNPCTGTVAGIGGKSCLTLAGQRLEISYRFASNTTQACSDPSAQPGDVLNQAGVLRIQACVTSARAAAFTDAVQTPGYTTVPSRWKVPAQVRTVLPDVPGTRVGSRTVIAHLAGRYAELGDRPLLLVDAGEPDRVVGTASANSGTAKFNLPVLTDVDSICSSAKPCRLALSADEGPSHLTSTGEPQLAVLDELGASAGALVIAPEGTTHLRARIVGADEAGPDHGVQPRLFTQIAGYANHSVAIADDGTVWAWGGNGSGELGDGTDTNRSTPVQVTGLTGKKITQVAVGQAYSVAVADDGTVWAWGRNYYGQLGDGTTTDRNTPEQVASLTGRKITQVAVGHDHSVAVADDGTVWAWGNNIYGQLGDGTTTKRNTPQQVASLTGRKITQVTAGFSHSVAVADDGTVWAWGRNYYGQLGDGTTTDRNTPEQVTGLTGKKITQVAVGHDHSVAVADDGTVWAWGDNIFGQLGDGTNTKRNTPQQVASLAGRKITQVAAGRSHSVAVADDGTVWAWGYNCDGQLGDGTKTNRNTPEQVTGLTGKKITQVAAGIWYSVAVADDGTAWAWGYNASGQLGDGTTTNRSTPIQVPPLPDLTP